MWVFILFLFVPLIEIALFIQVGGLIGLWPTIGLVILSAVVGTWLVQSQGLRAWAELNGALRSFQNPTRPMAHGAMIVVAGMLLLTPGFFTDTLGLLLLIPRVRDWLMTALAARVTVVGGFGPAFGTPRPAPRDPHADAWQAEDPRYRTRRDDDVIDADYVPLDQPPRDVPRGPGRPSGWSQG